LAFRSTTPLAEHVRQAHQLDELEERIGGVPQHDPASVPTRAELQPREGVDGHGVRLDAGDVADDDLAAPGEKRADAIAEPGKIGTRDRAANRERDLERPGMKVHRSYDPMRSRISSAS
jgi:hypothetical protein